MPPLSTSRPLVALDTETTGIDLFHGAMPFLVTTCRADGTQAWWEADVDPLTRQPLWDTADLRAVEDVLRTSGIVGQNIKFDHAALRALGIKDWPWPRTHDTLVAGHLLGSNLPHNLTDMAMQYLGIDIEPFEQRLKAAVAKCRSMVQQARLKVKRGGREDALAAWRIAEEGLEGMPSAKAGSKRGEKGAESGSPWKFDCWLPRAVASYFNYADDHPWWTVCSDYANADSAATMALWKAMEPEVRAKGLWPLYAEKMRNMPALTTMERRGTTVLVPALGGLRDEYAEEIAARADSCRGIAWGMGYRLDLPKGSGGNASLMTFCYGEGRETGSGNGRCRWLDLPVVRTTGTGAPSLNKDVIDEYRRTLDGPQLDFVVNLGGVRKRAKSVEYLDSYRLFGIPARGDVLVLHPSVNPTATATTRFSMSNPNLQQVSREATKCDECHGEGCDECGGTGEDLHSVRRVFGPGPGREWYSADAANIELRIPAYESGEKVLIELFERPNDPPYYGSQHMLNFSVVYDDIWRDEMRAVGFERVGPHCKKKFAGTNYKWAKGGGLAMQYQCGRDTADRAFRRPGYDKIKDFLVHLKAHNDRQVRFAEKHGYVETIPDRSLGMKRGYPLLCARGEHGRIVPTTPLNYRTQGTSGWWMVRAINRCWDQLEAWRRADGFDGYIVLTVHDELVFDFPKSKLDASGKPGNLWRMRILQKQMEKGGEDIGIPTPVSVEHHAVNWAEGVTL